ncbi:class I SAM-dependent methyltransferase [Marinovum sp.]|uniref:class I SAM-dependent methyltransferase n=1 Tax=Marinovum sp. TaxID=2024839 RepID=UPI002B277B0E|nr:SAM-dependent methyltransferase [Marinovum sp.]
MSAVDRAALQGIYAESSDPWNFRQSTYEQEKFAATLGACARMRYGAILEIGCGNGELARRLAARTDRYVGLDAVPRALAAASEAVPGGEFLCAYFPCRLPEGRFELIVVSEFLYFLDRAGVAALAAQIAERWPLAEVLTVNYLGATGNDLQGGPAADHFAAELAQTHHCDLSVARPGYRLDRLLPKPEARA